MGHRMLVLIALLCCAGLLMAPSCQEEQVEKAAAAPVEEGKVAKEQPAGPAFEAQVAGGFYPRDAD